MNSKEALIIKPEVLERVRDNYGRHFEHLSDISAEKITNDVLSPQKIDEQIQIIEEAAGGSVAGKKILEIGSGFGIFTIIGRKVYKALTFGVEPSSEGFGGSFELSQQILKDNGLDPAVIKNGVGESIPYEDNSFDIVYSTNVLEHVTDPAKVIGEAIRVTAPGGFIQIIFPSYGSFFDGHYASFYLPYQPKWLWKFWLKLNGRDPHFADTLRTELNYFSIKRILRLHIVAGTVQLRDTGEQVFKIRMRSLGFTPYAGLTRVKSILEFFRKIGILKLAAWFLLLVKAHSPLIISMRKSD